jgi:hypothetical protein
MPKITQLVTQSDGLINGVDPTPVDPFENLESLRLNQSFSDAVSTKKVLTTILVRKPSKQEFIRVHPSETYRMNAGILRVEQDREAFLVAPALHDAISSEMTSATLYTFITSQGVVALWPISLPDINGRRNSWLDSATKAAQIAQHSWIRVVSNQAASGYDCFEAVGKLAEPEWPSHTFSELLRLAFKDKFIDSSDHLILKRLRGEVT